MKTVRHNSKNLFVPLSTDEIGQEVERIISCVESIADYESKIDTMKESIKMYKENIDILSAEIKTSSVLLRAGKTIDVPCKTVFDWDLNRVQVFRKDTWECIDDREMTSSDKPEITDEQETEMARQG
jgi:hypothetical protein